MFALGPISVGVPDLPRRHRPGLRWSVLAVATGAVLLLGYLWIVCLISIVLAAANSADFSLARGLGVAFVGWLAAHRVAPELPGGELGVLPLAPTVFVMWLIAGGSAWVARRCRLRRPAHAGKVIAAMALSHALAGAAIAVVFRDVASPANAFGNCGLTAAIASTAGVFSRQGLRRFRQRTDALPRAGFRAGVIGVGAAAGCGGVIVFASICLSVPEFAAMLARTGSAGDAFGSVVLSLVYLPNAAVAGWSFAVGAGLSIGTFALGPTYIAPGPVPQLPLLAALPTSGPTPWWFAAMLLPIGVGALVGFRCLDAYSTPLRRLRQVAVAALIAALGTAVLAGACGGRLGQDIVVSLHPGLVGLATFCWIAIPAALVVLVAEDGESAQDVPRIPMPRTGDDRVPR